MNNRQNNARHLLDYLTSSGAQQVIRTIVGTNASRYQVAATHVRPGGAVSVSYRVNLAHPWGPACSPALARGREPGRSEAEKTWQQPRPDIVHPTNINSQDISTSGGEITLVVSTEKLPRGSAHALRIILPTTITEEPQTQIHASWWIYPHDPKLRGLAHIDNIENLRHVLAQSNHPKARALASGLQQTRTVVYRPTRRAVICGRDETGPQAWAKVAAPERITRLARTHSLLAASKVPVPEVLAYPSADTLVQAHGRGYPLSQLISSQPNVAAQMFAQIKEVLDGIPKTINELPARESWTDRRLHYGKAMITLLPDLSAPVASLLTIIDRLLVPNQSRKPVHGDLFEANLLTDGTTITTLLDLDTMGPGLRADDYACLLAHVSVLPFLTPNRWVRAETTEPWRARLNQFLWEKRCPDYAESETVLEAWRLQAERECIPADLYARCAAVTLSLASSASLKFGEEEARARFKRAQWWAELAHAYE